MVKKDYEKLYEVRCKELDTARAELRDKDELLKRIQGQLQAANVQINRYESATQSSIITLVQAKQ